MKNKGPGHLDLSQPFGSKSLSNEEHLVLCLGILAGCPTENGKQYSAQRISRYKCSDISLVYYNGEYMLLCNPATAGGLCPRKQQI